MSLQTAQVRMPRSALFPSPTMNQPRPRALCLIAETNSGVRTVQQGVARQAQLRVRTAALGSTSASILPEQDGTVLVQDDLDTLLQVLPVDVRLPLVNHPARNHLLEVVLDLGRRPEARFLGGHGGEFLRDSEITAEDLQAAESAVGEFGGDNRAGIPGTLHRISAMRNRKGKIVGLTCRVGRAVSGHIDMIRDILDVPNSILFLGRPGVGKTTVIRELARVMADDLKKRVVIVDTSNEIGGDGDIPHPGIGSSRRMQVPDPAQQHQVMIEAVENHMPEVIIVDEIGTEAEALACRTIAERGVQLIGTAHGQLLENLLKNPTLTELVGGVESVTLGDDEARMRGTQKTVLERKAPPTFPLLVEMRERVFWVMHWVEDSVDALLSGRVPMVQVRYRDPATRTVEIDERPYSVEDLVDDMLESSSNNGSNNGASSSSTHYSSSLDEDGFEEETGLSRELHAVYSSFAGKDDEGYAWAQRIQNMSDKDALREMAAKGYLGMPLAMRSGRGGGSKSKDLMFGTGTGTGRRNKSSSSRTKSVKRYV